MKALRYDAMGNFATPVENSGGFGASRAISFYKNSKISSERLRQSANSTLVACTRAQKRFLSAATIFAPGRMLITTACATPQPEARFRGVFGYPRKIFGGKMSVGLAVRCWSKENPDLLSQARVAVMVAGAGFEPTTS
ncbi:hypothetical protein, partial [Olsenella sp. HMSC062G07]|uniref:hypothetical protein n=1 Tax=Olsenella sp. HMSC062G07 TaxID=1739330 RepID=UPI001AEFB350